MFFMVDAVYPASSQMYVTQIQQCTTVSSSALLHIGTVFSNVIELRLSEKMIHEIICHPFPADKVTHPQA